MIAALLISVVLTAPPYDCPILIRQDLEVRHQHCVKRGIRVIFTDPDEWPGLLATCDHRVRRSARIWGCPVPKEWGEPVKWTPPKPKEDE